MLKKKIHDLTICFTYNFSCLHSSDHNFKKFQKEYRIYEEIGRGGFGVVYKAFRIADNAPVAVKFIKHKHVREWTIFERQMIPTEICYLEKCGNIPGVVKLVDWFTSSKGFLLVMNRPKNFMDLFDVLSVYGRLDEIIAGNIFVQVLDTVIQLKEKHSIVHRDIKDENVIIDMKTGQTMLVDFGAADLLESAKLKDFQGTKSYCPPEWFKRKCYLPIESTVWSLGILLYVLLTGNVPFKNEIQICLGRPKFPEYVSEESQNLIKKCLSPSPECRPYLKEILEHPWLKSLNKKSLNKETNNNFLASGSFQHSWEKPFHAILHRRSIKRGRRRDADAASGNLSNFSDNNDDTDKISSTEEECSYRQATNKLSNNNSIHCQSATPITVPQRVLDAIASSTALFSNANIDAALFSSSNTTLTLFQDTPKKMPDYNFHLIDSSSGFETAAEEYFFNKSSLVWEPVCDNYDYLTSSKIELNNKNKIIDNKIKCYSNCKMKLEKKQKNWKLFSFKNQKSLKLPIKLNQDTSSTIDDNLTLSNNQIVLDEESSINGYFSALDDLIYQNVFITSSEEEKEVTKINNISEKDVIYHPKFSFNLYNLTKYKNEKNEKNEKNKNYDIIKNVTLDSSFQTIESKLSITNSAKIDTLPFKNYKKQSTFFPLLHRRKKYLSRRLRNAVAFSNIRQKNCQNNDSTTSSKEDLNLSKLSLLSVRKKKILETNFDINFYRSQSVPINNNFSHSNSVNNILVDINQTNSLNLLNNKNSKSKI